MYPILIPIINHHGGKPTVEYTYPQWVEAMLGIALAVLIIGFLAMVGVAIASILKDGIDPFEKPYSYAFVAILLGLALAVIAMVLMLITGVPIDE